MSLYPSFPTSRPRRLRRTAALRGLVRETAIGVDDLILPLFVAPGRGVREPISSMPGHCQLSLDELAREVREVRALGVPAVLLFGLPPEKDERASGAYARDGIVQEAIRVVREQAPELVIVTDVCLCEYMSHGHCGVVEDGQVLNDPSVELLARTAVSHVEAGADVVAP